jgi:hypothetical protein
MRHHEGTAIEHIVRDEPVEEPHHICVEVLGLAPQLLQRLGQAMRDPHVLPAHRPEQLAFVVPAYAERGAVGDHAHDET